MSTRARKDRKKAGIKFSKPAKVGTPLEDRAIPLVQDRNGRRVGPVTTHLSNRIAKRIDAAIKIRDLDKPAEPVKKARSKKVS